MTTKEAIEYIVSTTREYKDRNDDEGKAEIITRWVRWSTQNGPALREAARAGDAPSVVVFLWSDTLSSFAIAIAELGSEDNYPAAIFLRACLALAKEAEKYATPQD